MKQVRLAAFAALMLVTAVAAAQAQTLTTGTVEFTPTVAFNRSSVTVPGSTLTGTATHLNLNAAVSRCMNERFQVQAAALLQHRDLGGNGRTAFGASAGGQWNFPSTNSVVPFFSANLGMVQYQTDGTSDRAVLAPMLRVGFRSMINESRSLNASIGYQHETNSKSTFEKNSDLFDVGVGVSLFSTH